METAIKAPKILLPAVSDLSRWAVVACDQFTSEPEYWKGLESYVGNSYSTLNLVYPEIYLSDQPEKRIAKINENINDYLSAGVFNELPEGFILTVRKTPYVEKRLGLIIAVDLEKYDYKKGSKNLIRATEATIEERIPPRVRIRKDAKIEFPHIMLLYDDEQHSVIEKLYDRRSEFEKVYDFDLNMNGGHIEGYFIKDVKGVIDGFAKLLDPETLENKYGEDTPFLFAVGDGNHSLATAKTHWEDVKCSLSEEEQITHPARFALVEAVNVFDEGIYFEPIYRFVSGIDREKFLKEFAPLNVGTAKVYTEEIIDKHGDLSLLEGIKNCDAFIKEYISANGGNVDYVHGDENIRKLVDANKNSLGILFEKLDKKDLFPFVVKSGNLPKKTFSMGEAVEKRYYLEGKMIVR